jgi:hypothetical protein
VEIKADKELLVSISRLREIALNHSKHEHDDEEIEEAIEILKYVEIYAHKVSHERSVQISQIEDNASDIRRVLNQSAQEGYFPRISHAIDNLVQYCGA